MLIVNLGLFVDIHRTTENLGCPRHTFPAEFQQGNFLPSYSSSQANSHAWPLPHFLPAFLCFLLAILLSKLVTKPSAKMLCSGVGPKYEKRLKSHVLQTLHLALTVLAMFISHQYILNKVS
jgi:hypothetical protein